MGSHRVRAAVDEADQRRFVRAVLRDLTALERLLARGAFDDGPPRMGAEQEMFLVDAEGRPALAARQVLAAANDPRLTTELARYNLEANLPPRFMSGDFLRRLEDDLNDVLRVVTAAGAADAVAPVLTGILPSLRPGDVSMDAMTDEQRYGALNDALCALRREPFRLQIRGEDELEISRDDVMLESVNTSLQLHFQVAPDRFVDAYNLAQAITAPLLAAAVNSPVLLGKRLWQETRVAVFEGAVDARSEAERSRGGRARVSFGERWIDDVLTPWRDDVVRHPAVLVRDVPDDPLRAVDRGEAPQLSALALHNGTIWRWNRPCYGITDGRPHLRIESRVLPSGPTVVDEVCNAALFYGLMLGLAPLGAQVRDRMAFAEARKGFVAVARDGLDADIGWLDGERVSVRKLLLERLLGAADDGLASVHVPVGDRERYLGTIRARVETGRTGAVWIAEAASARIEPSRIVSRMRELALTGTPVHRWPRLDAAGAGVRLVSSIMSTDLLVLRPQDSVDLAAVVMQWEHVRHLPVEERDGTIVGLVSHGALLRLAAWTSDEPPAVRDVMEPPPPTIAPDETVAMARRTLLESNRSCLCVLERGRLAGIVTERDLLRALAQDVE